MKIAFIHSPEDYYDQNYGTLFVPLWAYYLASFVPEDWEAEIVDCRVENPAECGAADVFAFSGINQDFNAINSNWRIISISSATPALMAATPRC